MENKVGNEKPDRVISQLRALGRKFVQLREAIDACVDPSGEFPIPVKQAAYVTTILRQLASCYPSDAFMLSIVPCDKVYQSPTAIPELLKLPPIPLAHIPSPSVAPEERKNEFYESMENYATDAVKQLPPGVDPLSPEMKGRKALIPVPQSLINRLYYQTSSQRLGTESA